MDILKSFYTTEIRLAAGSEEIRAKIRWYKTKFDSTFPVEGTAFFSNVWNTEVGSEYPQDGIGEVGLERVWDKGEPPEGISGKSTYTPLSWFVEGPPPDAFVQIPIGSCGKQLAPQLLSSGIGLSFLFNEEINDQCLPIGIGLSFQEILEGTAYVEQPIGIGLNFAVLIDGHIVVEPAVSIGFEFQTSQSASLVEAIGVGMIFDAMIPGIGWAVFPSGVDLGFVAIYEPIDMQGSIGIALEFEGVLDGIAYVEMSAGIGLDFYIEEPTGDEMSAGIGLDFYEEEIGGPDMGAGIGLEFENDSHAE